MAAAASAAGEEETAGRREGGGWAVCYTRTDWRCVRACHKRAGNSVVENGREVGGRAGGVVIKGWNYGGDRGGMAEEARRRCQIISRWYLYEVQALGETKVFGVCDLRTDAEQA